MYGFSLQALLAIMFGVLVLPILAAPYVAWSYRRGTTGPGHAVVTALGVVYAMALWTYTILPLPETDELICDGSLRVQFIPFHAATDVDWGAGFGVLTDRALWQVLLNVALFVPFGALATHLFGWAARRVVVAGFAISLLIELTQVTGNWFVYPCAYRLFDADDLIANTAGAAIGIVLAPLVRFVPGQRTRSPDKPSPVRPSRRLVGMALDVIVVWVTAAAVVVAGAVVIIAGGRTLDGIDQPIGAVAAVVAAVLLLLVVPWRTGGATPGQRAVMLRTVRPGGTAPTVRQWCVRFATGAGGFVVVNAIADLFGWSALNQMANLWVAASALVVVVAHTRGISGYAAGVVVVDARESRVDRAVADTGVDPRRMSSAVFAFGGLLYILGSLLVLASAVSPEIGLGLAAIGVVGIVVASLVLVGYVLATGVTIIRREGRSIGNLLALLAAAGVLGLVAVLVLALVTSWTWLAVPAMSGLAVSAYLGFLFAAFLIYGQIYARQNPDTNVDAVVVLGSRIFEDRVPPLLASRIDRGIEVLNDASMQGRSPVLILSGGQGPNETMPEAEAMARYAEAEGVDSERLRRETASLTTEQNLTFSRELLAAEGRGTSMVVATNDFHAFRAAIIARELGIRAQVVGARTARYFFPSAVLREFVGVLARTPRLHITMVVLLAAATGALSWLVVR